MAPNPNLRRIRVRLTLTLAVLWTLWESSARAAFGPDQVTLVRTPEGGIQPQAAVDGSGVVHLIFYKGDPSRGDLFYARQEPGKAGFSTPSRVNQEGKAMAMGTIRGAQLAIGKNGRVHVVWNGGAGTESAKHPGPPLFFARLNDRGTAFEPERDLITYAAGLDGGSSVAADGQGNVYVAWHARVPGGEEDEGGRSVFVARSMDEGKTFAKEQPIPRQATGACGCCGMRAFADAQGALYILYRAASQLTNRDEVLLVSRNHGADFQVATAGVWKTGSCPMSSAALAASPNGALAAWETQEQIWFSIVDSAQAQSLAPISPPGEGRRKHPAIVRNQKGNVLLVWTEGTGWQKGGAVAWQLFDRDGRALAEHGRADGVPVWSLATAFARPDGGFVIVY